ncbi:MAG: sodium:proton antiporter [Catalinimonas sp.]
MEEVAPAPTGDHASADHDEHRAPAPWAVLPFVVLLGLIAAGPLFFEHFWHRNYPVVAVSLGLLVVLYYVFGLHNAHQPVHALAEYVQFIALLSSLYVASGGIMIRINRAGTPGANAVLLAVGAVVANLIGTTGASMLLIRPFLRLNARRLRAYHVVFFIFVVSNVGGALTPVGDPPLFLGFLKGVPFFWSLQHNLLPWVLGVVVLLGVFWAIDRRNPAPPADAPEPVADRPTVVVEGKRNFLWLAVIIAAVFVDPTVFDWVPGFTYDGQKFSFVRETIMFTVVFLSYRFADRDALRGNEFHFEPIREVGFLFIGIFGTMMPALELVGGYAGSEAGAALVTRHTLYWATGLLSGVLDNAPTYLNFLAAAVAAQGGSINEIEEVRRFAAGGYANSVVQLTAISVAAVFFGAMTYIGNGPNFMVRAIAEQNGLRMPSFFGYIIRYAVPYLLPVLGLVYLVFFLFG